MLTADHGLKGIDVFRRERPHVTILDFEMPDIDGIEVLRQIRAIASHSLVIMLTGTAMEARELGMTDFLATRFSLHELSAAQQKKAKRMHVHG